MGGDGRNEGRGRSAGGQRGTDTGTSTAEPVLVRAGFQLISELFLPEPHGTVR